MKKLFVFVLMVTAVITANAQTSWPQGSWPVNAVLQNPSWPSDNNIVSWPLEEHHVNKQSSVESWPTS